MQPIRLIKLIELIKKLIWSIELIGPVTENNNHEAFKSALATIVFSISFVPS